MVTDFSPSIFRELMSAGSVWHWNAPPIIPERAIDPEKPLQIKLCRWSPGFSETPKKREILVFLNICQGLIQRESWARPVERWMLQAKMLIEAKAPKTFEIITPILKNRTIILCACPTGFLFGFVYYFLIAMPISHFWMAMNILWNHMLEMCGGLKEKILQRKWLN